MYQAIHKVSYLMAQLHFDHVANTDHNKAQLFNQFFFLEVTFKFQVPNNVFNVLVNLNP